MPSVDPPACFADRTEAGRELAAALRRMPEVREDALVLALPRGGVPVASVVARELGAPLDVFVVRKLGHPEQPELALGAIASSGVRVLNRRLVEMSDLAPGAIEEIAAAEQRELERRERLYRGDRPPPPVEGRAVVLVDDGLATGSTMLAAIRALRQHRPARIVVAVPVAPASACRALRREADEVVCVRTPEPFFAIGSWYESFPQATDEEIGELLEQSRGASP